ncbi:11529_t:CDS:2 [Ambispora leptoticha]|uniref:11529_t:CDS:1 n=1 Tax=Ambispora leptoticha TaxID=144679 RepID=A0A9N8V7F2_9GLOM|nr:11529_t:CDS:2 [Ambispora leptoticha]
MVFWNRRELSARIAKRLNFLLNSLFRNKTGAKPTTGGIEQKMKKTKTKSGVVLVSEKFSMIKKTTEKHDESYSPLHQGEELPHDNFVNITNYGFCGIDREWLSLIKEIKRNEDNDFLTELFKWAQQEKVKRIGADGDIKTIGYNRIGFEIRNINIQKKTQEDYRREDEVNTYKIAKSTQRPYRCSYCRKDIDLTKAIVSGDNFEIRQLRTEKCCFQHLENCSFTSEKVKGVAKMGREDSEDKIKNDNLVIEYQNSQRETITTITPELQQIRDYCQVQGLNSLTLTDLQKQDTNNQQPTNYLPYILGGVGIMAIHGITKKVISYYFDEQKAFLGDIKPFTDYVKSLPSSQLMAEDECKHTKRYTLMLCVRNSEEQPIISHKLIDNSVEKKKVTSKGTRAVEFHDFILDVKSKLLTDDKYYLLLDNAKIHKAIKALLKEKRLPILDLFIKMNIDPLYLVPYTPQLNPVELCFNFLRGYVEDKRPRTYEQLKSVIDEGIEELSRKPMTEYFRHCIEYDFSRKTSMGYE